jgi:hypothetical protein
MNSAGSDQTQKSDFEKVGQWRFFTRFTPWGPALQYIMVLFALGWMWLFYVFFVHPAFSKKAKTGVKKQITRFSRGIRTAAGNQWNRLEIHNNRHIVIVIKEALIKIMPPTRHRGNDFRSPLKLL